MNFFKKQKQEKPKPSSASAGLPRAGDTLPDSLKAHSNFVKRVNCSQCGAPKSRPSVTAYIYCDFCGSLMDYDFRLANAGTNAGITNTIFHRIFTPVQGTLILAKARGDKETYRTIYRQIFSQWVQECPMAVSPRAKNDAVFREQLVAYFAESAVVKDFDPRQDTFLAKTARLEASLQRIPQPGGAWRVAGPFWEYAELFKQQMEMTYTLIHETGVNNMDPDKAPLNVALRMEYSTFCQAWLSHLSTADGEKLLKLYGLNAEYDEVKPFQTDKHQCGICGTEMQTVHGARQVVCDTCGYTIDVNSQPLPCKKCGAPLSLPVSANHVLCPYCSTDNRRV